MMVPSGARLVALCCADRLMGTAASTESNTAVENRVLFIGNVVRRGWSSVRGQELNRSVPGGKPRHVGQTFPVCRLRGLLVPSAGLESPATGRLECLPYKKMPRSGSEA